MPANWICVKNEKFGKKLMVAGILTGRGAIPLAFIPLKATVNSKVYIDSVLRPLVEQHLPALYPGELHRVWVHHDGARAHTSNETRAFCEQVTETTGIRFIKKKEIPVKSPDASPLDFFGFGYLKGKLRSRRAKTLDGLKRAAREVWSEISQGLVIKVFKAWIVRAIEIVKARGHHIENVKQIHNKQVFE